MRLTIDHRTGFRYAAPVRASYNEARMTPASTSDQTVWSSRVSVDPVPWSFTYTDYWGTTATTFELHEPHDRLTVSAYAVVETNLAHDPWDVERRISDTDLGWAELRRTARESMSELVTLNERTAPAEELAQRVVEVLGEPPRLAGLEACRIVADHLTYERGSTAVTSTARQVWAGRRGVCQDYAHVALGALRTIGLPARYVSGYLYPEPDRVRGHAVVGESHSWVEWWCGDWVAYDPTSMQPTTERYVRVGHGRDYGDVAPLRGTYSGGASEMFVRVEMTQLG